MLIHVKGNLLNAEEKYIMHGCNDRGVMGSGVALAIRNKWPKAYQDYVNFFKGHDGIHISRSDLGSIIYSPQPDGKVIINAITQKGYGRTGEKFVKYDAIDDIFRKLNTNTDISIVAIPMIGAGLGGGDWSVIESIIRSRAKNYDVKVYSL